MKKLINFKNLIIDFLIAIINEIQTIHSAVGKNEFSTILLKFEASIKLSILFSPFAFFIEVLTDWSLINAGYVLFVFGAIVLDHAFGSYRHLYVDKDFTFKQNIKGFFLKLLVAIAGIFLFEGINHIIVKDSLLKDYLEIVMRLIVFLYPAGSAFGNMSIVTNGKFPPEAWINRLKNFQKNLDPNDLKNDKDE